MDIWMSAYNTTTQALTSCANKTTPDDVQKEYLKGRFNKLVGSMKLFVSLDQGIGFTDNQLIDSGLIRGLFKYSNDPDIRRMKDELRDTFFEAANKILYFYDGRVSKDDPVTLIKDRFELTTKNFLHSAAFINEDNWKGIESHNDLVSKIPEYNHISRFLVELLERIPKENIIRSPQKQDTYGLMLEYVFDEEKSFLHSRVGFEIQQYLKNIKDPKDRNRTNFYRHLDENLDPQTSNAAKILIADEVYSQIVPWVAGNLYSFEEWDDFIGNSDIVNKVYKKIKGADTSSGEELQPLVNNLYQKGKMFNFLAAQNLKTISDIRGKVRGYLLDESAQNSKKIAENIMWEMYKSNHGEKVNSTFTNAGIKLVASISEAITPIKKIGFVVPVLQAIHGAMDYVEFFYLTKVNKESKDLIKAIDKILTKDT